MCALPDKSEEPITVPEDDISAMRRVVGRNIKNYRESLGVSQEKLARAVGLSVSAVSKWEQGQTIPSSEYVLALCTIFECSVRDLFDGI
jgi:transcriptional regulator with XRE-family HTH domain